MTSVFEHPTIIRFDGLLHECWDATCSIGINWGKPYQYISDEEWHSAEPLYKETGLSDKVREIAEICKDYKMKQLKNEIDYTLTKSPEEQKQTFLNSISILLEEVERISSRLNEYHADVIESEYNENTSRKPYFDTDLYIFKNSIFSISYILKPYVKKELVNTDDILSFFHQGVGEIPMRTHGTPSIGRDLIYLSGQFPDKVELDNYLAKDYSEEYVKKFIEDYTFGYDAFWETKARLSAIEEGLSLRFSNAEKIDYLIRESDEIAKKIDKNPKWLETKNGIRDNNLPDVIMSCFFHEDIFSYKSLQPSTMGEFWERHGCNMHLYIDAFAWLSLHNELSNKIDLLKNAHLREEQGKYLQDVLNHDITKDEFSKIKGNVLHPNITIRVDPNEIGKILAAIGHCAINEENKNNFAKLLVGDQNCNLIVLKENVKIKSFVYVFRQAVEAKYILNAKTQIQEWILYWFRNGTPEKCLSKHTVKDGMVGENPPKKENRYDYTPKKTMH